MSVSILQIVMTAALLLAPALAHSHAADAPSGSPVERSAIETACVSCTLAETTDVGVATSAAAFAHSATATTPLWVTHPAEAPNNVSSSLHARAPPLPARNC